MFQAPFIPPAKSLETNSSNPCSVQRSTHLPATLKQMTKAGKCPLGTLGSQGCRDKSRCHQGNDHMATPATLGLACQRLRAHLLY